jgi:hypothetical protein
MLRSMELRSSARSSGRSFACSVVRGHAAADVDADRGRDDRALGGHDRTDGGADAEVDVGHHRDPRADERQGGDVAQLLPRLVLDGDAVHPALDRRGGALGVEELVVVVLRVHGESLR